MPLLILILALTLAVLVIMAPKFSGKGAGAGAGKRTCQALPIHAIATCSAVAVAPPFGILETKRIDVS
jgi:hypothetical protein